MEITLLTEISKNPWLLLAGVMCISIGRLNTLLLVISGILFDLSLDLLSVETLLYIAIPTLIVYLQIYFSILNTKTFCGSIVSDFS